MSTEYSDIHPCEHGLVTVQLRSQGRGDSQIPDFTISWMDALRVGSLLTAAAIVSAGWLEVDMSTVERHMLEAHAVAMRKAGMSDD